MAQNKFKNFMETDFSYTKLKGMRLFKNIVFLIFYNYVCVQMWIKLKKPER